MATAGLCAAFAVQLINHQLKKNDIVINFSEQLIREMICLLANSGAKQKQIFLNSFSSLPNQKVIITAVYVLMPCREKSSKRMTTVT